ncbi:hypothetical protein [Nocardia sp. NPDC056100]|uniref:hypothetical protein n=1 Tax=Nocardia sp. NPDC056100 TaxID=3345712 RepID=UPI0035D588AC
MSGIVSGVVTMIEVCGAGMAGKDASTETSVEGNVGTVLLLIAIVLGICAIWGGPAFGVPPLLIFFPGIVLFGTSPEYKAHGQRSAEAKALQTQREADPGIRISRGMVSAPGQEPISAAGARASVESSGALVKRATVTRIAAGGLLFGPVGAIAAGLGAKKTVEDRRLFVLVENAVGEQLIVEVHAKHEAEVRRWAVRFNTKRARKEAS